MALHRNSILVGIITVAFLSSPVLADDSAVTGREHDHRSEYLNDNYIYDFMGHQDSITVGLGDAPTSNIIIMHPTPWPSYINDTTIRSSARQGMSALENMVGNYMPGGGRTLYWDPDPPPVGMGKSSLVPPVNTGGSSKTGGSSDGSNASGTN